MKHIIKALGLTNAKKDRPSPYLDANPVSKATFWWLNSHLWRGFKRPLMPCDIYTVLPEESSQYRAEAVSSIWSNMTPEQQKAKNSLLRAVLRPEWKLFSLSLILILLGEVCKFVQPFLISELVMFFKHKDPTSGGKAWGIAVAMVLMNLIYSVASTYGQYLGQVVAMRMRTSCTAILTRKIVRMTRKALGEMSTGTVVNLLATDVEKFYNAACEFRGLFVGPVVLMALIILISVELQIALLPGLAFVVLLTILRLQLGNIAGKVRLQIADWTDKRISLVSEIVYAMRMLKCYCWEAFFRDRARALRSAEIKRVGQAVFINGLNLNLGHSCDRIVTFLLVLTFILTGNNFDYKLAVQILTWMKMGQLGFLNFPVGYSMWCQMTSSVSRMQKVMLADEYIDSNKEDPSGERKTKTEPRVLLKNISASWGTSEKNTTTSDKMLKNSILKSISSISMVTKGDGFVPSGTFSLRNVTMDIKSAGLVSVIGPVGSGKSSLLLAIIGSLPLGAGKRRVEGSIAYVPQEPWIRVGTVRENILMGEKMNRKKYNAVLRTCALQKDMVIMQKGDNTKIGDKGNSLSGGQKARISLARALYQDADIYVLDDPFTALDGKVAGHIFFACVRMYLKDKIVILATHRVNFLTPNDSVIILSEGKMVASGSTGEVKHLVAVDTFTENLQQTAGLDEEEGGYDILATQDKANLVQSLFRPSIVKETAHIPTMKRATPMSVYMAYVKAGYGYVFLVIFIILLLAQQACSIYAEWWLVYKLSGGSKKKGYGHGYVTLNGTITHDDHHDYSLSAEIPEDRPLIVTASNPDLTTAAMESFVGLNATGGSEINLAAAVAGAVSNPTSKLGPYAIAVWASFLIGVLSVLAGTAFLVLASRNLYNTMFNRVLKAPMKAFGCDKAGEMLNRFSRDTGRMDDIIPTCINATSLTAAIIVTHCIYICLINHYVILATLPFLVCVALLVNYCVQSIRDTKRLESEFRTPTFGHLQAVLPGLEVIRAFNIERMIIYEADTFLNRHTGAWHMYIGCIYWMKLRFNWLVTAYLAVVLTIALASPSNEAMSAPLGLSLAYIIVFMNRVQYFATHAAMLDANMTSVEHVYEFTHLDQEEDHPKTREVPPEWPDKSNIFYQCVNLTYVAGGLQILKDVNFTVKNAEKVAILGRTGAGKSSLLSTLLRLEKFTGKIIIGGIDTRKIKMRILRKKITMIPQDPVLYSGTLRTNMDPYREFTDEQIWSVLEKINLKRRVSKLPGRLDMEIADGGSNNFSVGQRQLIWIGRALLNKPKIMALDEPTANVDIQTDGLIQQILFEDFADSTILCTSHRLETTVSYDKVIIIEQGEIVEMGKPHVLLQNQKGRFYKLVQMLGPTQAAVMAQQAEVAFHRQLPDAQGDVKNVANGSPTGKSANSDIGVPEKDEATSNGHCNGETNFDHLGLHLSQSEEATRTPPQINSTLSSKMQHRPNVGYSSLGLASQSITL